MANTTGPAPRLGWVRRFVRWAESDDEVARLLRGIGRLAAKVAIPLILLWGQARLGT